MKQVEERYISLLTDFGFKRIFGTAMNKDLLICFLNSLFNGRQVVKDVSYLNPEHVGDVYTDRRAIFDVYCEGENGEKFIVEMQNAYQAYFKDRSLFYSTFPIREQAPKGSDWDFKLNHVYTVALLNFNMNEDAFDKEKIRHHVQLCDTATHKIFYDKLEFIYVEIAKFNKPLEQLDTLYEKWPISKPSARPSCFAVSIEFLISRYAFLLASYSLISCGVNLAISASSKRRSKTLSHSSFGRWVSL